MGWVRPFLLACLALTVGIACASDHPRDSFRDGGSRDASGPPDSGPDLSDCVEGGGSAPILSSGPIRLAEEGNHGLPGCYRCGLAVADFDGDGRLDVAMAGAFDTVFVRPEAGSDYNFNNRVRLYKNESCPGGEIRFRFQAEVPDIVGGGGAVVVGGDFNGDGRPDFAVQIREGDSPGSDTSAFINGGSWRFERRPLGRFDTNSTSLGMTAADVDQDGRDDLVLSSDAYGAAPGLWYHLVGDAFREEQPSYPHRITYGGTIAAGDLDGDGFPDIVVGGNSDQPFGSYDCSDTLLYGEIHFNKGASARPKGIGESGIALAKFALRSDRGNPPVCAGMDNAGMLIADVDQDGTSDIVIGGSADGFQGPPGLNGSHYDFVVLRNVDGTGRNFVTFENAGMQYPNGTTNGGTGNLDEPNIAVGDLTGDGFPEIFLQGHHRDYGGDVGSYVFDSRLFLNVGGSAFEEIELPGFALSDCALRPPQRAGCREVGEGGQAIADFNNDGKQDLLFAGATLPFHSNGNNPDDRNSASTIFTFLYRNARP